MPVFFQSFGGGFPGGAQQFFNGGFPGGFEGMGGMGGMPGQGQGGPPQSDNTKFYKLLGVEKDAGEAEIKKAYKRMAIKNHPDKGGDPEKFKEISHAYEVRWRPASPFGVPFCNPRGDDTLKPSSPRRPCARGGVGVGGGGGVDPERPGEAQDLRSVRRGRAKGRRRRPRRGPLRHLQLLFRRRRRRREPPEEDAGWALHHAPPSLPSHARARLARRPAAARTPARAHAGPGEVARAVGPA